MAYDKVVDSAALDAELGGIADAIRAQTGGEALLSLEEMAASIRGIRNADDYLAAVMNRTVDRLVNDQITGTLPTDFQRDNKNLIVVDLPNAAKANSAVFYGCINLVSVKLGLREMGAEVFGGCRNLTEIYLPELTTITGWGYVFNVCLNLQKAVFPKLVGDFRASDFNACSKLTALVLGGDTVVPLTATNVFANTPIASGKGYIYVRKTLLDAYKAATNWSTYAAQFRAIEDYPRIMEVQHD